MYEKTLFVSDGLGTKQLYFNGTVITIRVSNEGLRVINTNVRSNSKVSLKSSRNRIHVSSPLKFNGSDMILSAFITGDGMNVVISHDKKVILETVDFVKDNNKEIIRYLYDGNDLIAARHFVPNKNSIKTEYKSNNTIRLTKSDGIDGSTYEYSLYSDNGCLNGCITISEVSKSIRLSREKDSNSSAIQDEIFKIFGEASEISSISEDGKKVIDLLSNTYCTNEIMQHVNKLSMEQACELSYEEFLKLMPVRVHSL